MNMNAVIMILFAIFALCTKLSFALEDSPALFWSPERSMVDLPDVSSVDSFSSSDFYEQYLAPLMQGGIGNAVVFIQDKLSVDDFTNYADVYSLDSSGGAFKNVKRLMEDHYSLEVPQVTAPHEAVERLKRKFEGDVHVLGDPSQLESLRLGQGKRFLLIVDLQPIIGAGDEEKVISTNDAIVGEVANHLQKQSIKYSAMFTGKSAQDAEVVTDDLALHSNRHLLATDVNAINEKCKFLNVSSDSVYVFMCGFRVCIKDDKDKNVKTKCAIELNATITDDIAKASTHTNTSGEVILSFEDMKDAKGNEYTATVGFEVALKQDRWMMERMYLNFNQKGSTGNSTTLKNATLINYNLDTVVPRLYSFHCTRLRLFVETVKDTTYKKFAGSVITLEGFQFQVFDIAHGRFFHAQDCVGFFTTGIWMGIVPGLLLLGLLIYGTMMVLNLSVMDKFDDPKGKTIIVNAGE